MKWKYCDTFWVRLFMYGIMCVINMCSWVFVLRRMPCSPMYWMKDNVFRRRPFQRFEWETKIETKLTLKFRLRIVKKLPLMKTNKSLCIGSPILILLRVCNAMTSVLMNALSKLAFERCSFLFKQSKQFTTSTAIFTSSYRPLIFTMYARSTSS